MIAHLRKPIQYYSQVGQFQHAKDNHNCEEREREREITMLQPKMSVPFNLCCSQLSKGRKILIISISGNQSNTLQVHQASATEHRASSVIKQSVAPYATQNESPVRMLTSKSALARAAVTRSQYCIRSAHEHPRWQHCGRQ